MASLQPKKPGKSATIDWTALSITIESDRSKWLIKLTLLSLAVYLTASINFSILLFKILGKGDPRDRCSGNAGTMNVIRQLGIIWGSIVLLFDIGRAVIIAKLGSLLLPPALVTVLGFFLVAGNQKPIFHGFRGGKGVASYLGFIAFISPITAGIACLVWVSVYGLFHQPFIGSFFMIAILALGTMNLYSWSWLPTTAAGATVVLIYLAHKRNIIEFRKGRAKT
jgi:glycerol-3-phosphate acyltransferase PlsY